ncbi:MAG: ChbG/HpnK family deacetylase [Anaerolineae bacterium]|nr:ChbG/HpnK family deacetylase [Anaerolineae bacterium]
MLRRLIVNADDFGLTPGVSHGIIKAHREGIVTSTSVMINMPYAEQSLRLVQQEAPNLGIGLHLNLTAGKPVSPPEEIPDLITPTGEFLDADVLIDRLASVELAQVKQELTAQIDRFEAIMGQPPDHLDNHHYISTRSLQTATLFIELARESGCPIRNAAARKDILNGDLAGSYSRIHGKEKMPHLIDELSAILNGGGVSTPDHFIGGFYGDGATLGNLLLIILDLEEGISELMCHPAEVDDELRSASSYNERRGDELAALVHPSTREVINSSFVQLINFSDIT